MPFFANHGLDGTIAQDGPEDGDQAGHHGSRAEGPPEASPAPLSSGARLARSWRPDSDQEGGSRSGPPVRGRAPLGPGHELGDYRLLELIGRGAQGEVWKALRCQPFLEAVAIKILKPSLAHNPSRMAQFCREAQRGGRLSGPGLLTVYELGSCDGHYFMAMPLVGGGSLREVIQGRAQRDRDRGSRCDRDEELEPLGPWLALDEEEYLPAMARALARAAHGLARAHAQKIAHRDIKPANILLGRAVPEEVYLCDFGLGRDLEVATVEQMCDGAGTPIYMAPERLARLPADEVRCDIYSMGATLFEALTLRRPFKVPHDMGQPGLSIYLVTARPRRPSEVRPGFPERLEAVVMRALARDAKDRHGSAEELARDIENAVALAGPPVLRPTAAARPHLPLERGPCSNARPDRARDRLHGHGHGHGHDRGRTRAVSSFRPH